MKKLKAHFKKFIKYYVLTAFISLNFFIGGQALLSSTSSAEVSGIFSNFLSAFFHAIGPVEAEIVEPETIEISGPDIVIIGQSKRLTPTIAPSDTTDKSVYWTTNNDSVLEVTSGGIVVAKGIGSASIRATTSVSSIYEEILIEVIDFPSVSAFELDVTTHDIYVGTTATITPIDVAPELGRLDSITYTSLHPLIASVNEYGVVKGLTNGTATILAMAGSLVNSIDISVTTSPNPVVAPTSLTINGDSEGLIYRYTQLEADFGATIPTDTSVTWLSSDINIARVDNTGKVYGYKFEGNVTITAISNADDSLRNNFDMTFSKVFPTSVTLMPAKTEIIAGQSMNINFSFEPAETYDRQLTWNSSDPSVASISSQGEYGLLTGLKVGMVTITATSVMDENISASVTINVLKASTLNAQQEEDLYMFVRKGLGHYSLFFLDGLLGYLTMFYFLKGKQKQTRYFFVSIGIGFILSLLLEALQLFANGRSPLVTDAIINFLGYLTASIVMYLIFYFVKRSKDKKALASTEQPL